jgi:hypothetical protein
LLDAKFSIHHRLPGQSFWNVASPTVANAVLVLRHNEHVPQHHVSIALLIATFEKKTLIILSADYLCGIARRRSYAA